MGDQIIISIAREYGAGGHKIAENLAKKYNLTLYDNDILQKISAESDINFSDFHEYEEKKKNVLFTRTVAGYSNAPQDIIAEMEFDFLKKKAEEGESFVVVGRCANSVLKDYACHVKVFVTSSDDFKLNRIMTLYPELSQKEAEKKISTTNKKRKSFHNHYCKEKWGDSRHYDLVLSTSKIGIDKAVDVIDCYIKSANEK